MSPGTSQQAHGGMRLIPGSFSSVSTTPAYCVAALQFTASLVCRAARHPTPRHAAPPVHSSSHVVRRYFLFRRFCSTACRNNYNSTADSGVCVCTSSNCCSVNKTPRRAVKVNHSLVAFKWMSSFLRVSHLSRTKTTVLEIQTKKS